MRRLVSRLCSRSASSLLLAQCEELNRIVVANQSPVSPSDNVRQLFQNVTLLIADTANASELTPSMALVAFPVLANTSSKLRQVRSEYYGKVASFVENDKHSNWSGSSPYFSDDALIVLSAWLSTAEASVTCPRDRLMLLTAAVQLEVGDVRTLHALARSVCGKAAVSRWSTSELCKVVHVVSLALKRRKATPPDLTYVLAAIAAQKDLTVYDALRVLTALVRIRERRCWDVADTVSRRLAAKVDSFTNSELVFAIEIVALLDGCNEQFAVRVIDSCVTRASSFSPKNVADVCKYIAIIGKSSTRGDLANSILSRGLRRLLPALVQRADALLGKFSLRDARCVMRCFQAFDMRHSIVFSQLTPLISSETG